MTGYTAGNHDDIAALHCRTPLVFAVVAVLAFVLLLVAFRSVAIPLVSIALNLLSVGAAYGLITLIFQDGQAAGPARLHLATARSCPGCRCSCSCSCSG